MPADNVTLGNKISTGSVMVCSIYSITRCAGFVFIGGSFQWSIGGSDLIILTQNIASDSDSARKKDIPIKSRKLDKRNRMDGKILRN